MSKQEEPKGFDLEAAKARLTGKKGRTYWRGLEELAQSEEFTQWLGDEFPNRSTLLQIDRRSLLKIMGASMALAGLSGCRSVFLEEEKIVPYVKQPEELVLGKPLFYATAAPFSGYGVGCLIESREGRPIKVEGNPQHPESQGSSSTFLQAELLNMYDPDRSQDVYNEGELSTWEVFYSAVRQALADQKTKRGAGLRILTGSIASPTLADQLKGLLAEYPEAKWIQYDPLTSNGARAAALRGFGRPVQPVYDLRRARVIVSLDADFLLEMPGSLRYARDFADGRRVMGDASEMNRLYAIESMPTITGATADHRFRVRASEVASIAASLFAAISGSTAGKTSISEGNLAAIARDLVANRGAALVIPGDHQPESVHLLCHAINQAIGAFGSTVVMVPSMDESKSTQIENLKRLVDDLNAKLVEVLLMIGCNPVYHAPTDFQFGAAMQNCPLRIHHAHYRDETGSACTWHLPLTHFMEEWSDVRAYDGTASIVQPLIAPLFESRSAHQLLGALSGKGEDGHALLQSSWRAKKVFKGDFTKAWNRALNDGVVPNTRYAPLAVAFNPSALDAARPTPPVSGMELIIRPDATIRDGRYSNNGWQQEIAKPISKVTWENCFYMSPNTAKRLDLNSEDGFEITVRSQTVGGPVWVLPGHPDDSITVHLGYGRTNVGVVANEAGFNAFSLRHSDALGIGAIDGYKKTGTQSAAVSCVQIHNTMEGRDIARLGSLAQYKEGERSLHKEEEMGPVNATHPEHEFEQESMYPDEIFNYDGPQWGMTIDLNTCIGCNACVTACYAENNIPVVGKIQVKRGREMYWLRIDRYYTDRIEWDIGNFNDDPVSNPDYVFQPMMCQHCEKAPCEPVCPVGATVHSHEGLNQMVYNRCVGTRYCSNNCPYKVRRFNFLNYTDNMAQFDAHDENNKMRVPLLRLLNNPDVTVRGRGVMEKCTYCVQRINDARIEAKKLGRDPLDGEIVTACQQACPTKTIVFGNVADPKSAVSKIRSDERAYQVLRETQTRPRTSYLGKMRNLNPEIKA